jgi:hypothetical protein
MARSFKYGIGSQEVPKLNITNTYQRLSTPSPRSFKYGIGPQELPQREPGELDLLKMFAPIVPGGGLVDYYGGAPEFRRSKMAEGQRYYPSAYQHAFGKKEEKDPWAAFYQTLGAAGDVAQIAGTGAFFINPAVGGALLLGGTLLKSGSRLASRFSKLTKTEQLQVSNKLLKHKELNKNISDKNIYSDNPGWDRGIYNNTYEQKHRKTTLEKGIQNLETANQNKKVLEEHTLPMSGETTLWLNKVELDPQLIKNVDGYQGEHKFRHTSDTLKRLKKDIKKEGYKPDPIEILIREDGEPFILEGNHRLAEAIDSNRPTVSVNIRYKPGAEFKEGILNPKYILPDKYADKIKLRNPVPKDKINKFNQNETELEILQNKFNKLREINKTIDSPYKGSYHSKLIEAVEALTLFKGTGHQFYKTINNIKGIKQEEKDLFKLNFLENNQEKWTKQQVLDHLNKNKIEPEEIILGGKGNQLVWEDFNTRPDQYRVYSSSFKATSDKSPIDVPIQEVLVGKDKSGKYEIYKQRFDPDILHQEATRKRIVNKFDEVFTLPPDPPSPGGPAIIQDKQRLVKNDWYVIRDLHTKEIIKPAPGPSYFGSASSSFKTLHDAELAAGAHAVETKYLKPTTTETVKFRHITLDGKGGKKGSYEEILLGTDPDFITKEGKALYEARVAREKVLREETKIKNPELLIDPETGNPSYAYFKFKVLYKDPEWQKLSKAEVARYGPLNKYDIDQWTGPSTHQYTHPSLRNKPIRVRTGIYKTKDGKPTQFGEEIQDDYKQLADKFGVIKKEPIIKAHNEVQEAKKAIEKANAARITTGADKRFKNLDDAQKRLSEAQKIFGGSFKQPPDMPFSTKSSELAFRRLVQKAVKNDIDSVTWTPARQQGRRYKYNVPLKSIRLGRLGDEGFNMRSIEFFDTKGNMIFGGTIDLNTGRIGKYGKRQYGEVIEDFQIMVNKRRTDPKTKKVKVLLDEQGKPQSESAHITDILESTNKEVKEDILNLILKDKLNEERFSKNILDNSYTLYDFKNLSDDIELVIDPDKFTNLKKVYDRDILKEAKNLVKEYGGEVRRTNITSDTGILENEYFGKSIERLNSNVWEMIISPKLKKEILEHGIVAFAHGGYIKNYFNIEEGNI